MVGGGAGIPIVPARLSQMYSTIIRKLVEEIMEHCSENGRDTRRFCPRVWSDKGADYGASLSSRSHACAVSSFVSLSCSTIRYEPQLNIKPRASLKYIRKACDKWLEPSHRDQCSAVCFGWH